MYTDGRIKTTFLHSTVVKVLIPPEGSKAMNPAFDVTPNSHITRIITEKGIVEPVLVHTLSDLCP